MGKLCVVLISLVTWQVCAQRIQAQGQPVEIVAAAHGRSATFMSLSNDGDWLVTDYRAGTLWSVPTGRQMRALEGRPLACSRDGTLLISRTNNAARLWDLANGKELRLFPHKDSVVRAIFSADEKWIVTGSSDKSARLWETATGKLIQEFKHDRSVTSLELTKDGRWLITGTTGAVHVWKVPSGKKVRVLEDCVDFGEAAAISIDNKSMIMASSYDRIFDRNNQEKKIPRETVGLYDLETGRQEQIFPLSDGTTQSIALSGNGRLLAIASQKTVAVWDVESAKLVRRFFDPLVVPDRSPFFRHVCLSADGKWLAALGSRENGVLLWEVATGEMVAHFASEKDPAVSIKFASNGKSLIVGGAGAHVHLWDLTSRKDAKIANGLGRVHICAMLSHDGKRLNLGTVDGLCDWDLTIGKELSFVRTSFPVRKAIFCGPDGNIVTAGGDNGDIAVLDRTGTKTVRMLKGHPVRVTSLAASVDGKWLLSGQASSDDTARLWDFSTGQQRQVFKGHTGKIPSTMLLLSDGVAISQNGKWAVSTSWEKTAILWDLATGQKIHTFNGHTGPVLSVAISGDDRWLATASQDGTARLWELASGKELRIFESAAEDRSSWMNVVQVAFSKDNKSLFTCSYDHAARLFDIETGKESCTFKGHLSSVGSFVTARDDKRLLTMSSDGTTRLWDVATGKELCRLFTFQDGTWAVHDSENRFDASNGGKVEGLHWVAGLENFPLERFRDRFHDPGLLAKYMGFNNEPLRKVESKR
jgi:WD40 repeat protein